MSTPSPSPAELRNMLGANLRRLTRSVPSISALSRDLNINRTQFNRYLAGESFPRPDVLYRICRFFDVDARILLEPLEDIRTRQQDPIHHPVVADFLRPAPDAAEKPMLPTGFYRFSRPSFLETKACVVNLVLLFQRDGLTFLRGYEPRNVLAQQGLTLAPKAREFRGVVLPQEGGVSILASGRHAFTASYNFLAPVPSIENNFWLGYTARATVDTVSGQRAVRLVYEHLGHNLSKVLPMARLSGMYPPDALPPFHRRLLQLDAAFA